MCAFHATVVDFGELKMMNEEVGGVELIWRSDNSCLLKVEWICAVD